MVDVKDLLSTLLDEKKLSYCQDCGSCTGSCPMARAVPELYNPRRLLQVVSHSPEEAARREDLWLCAWCYRCTERCPQGIQPTEVFLLVRNLASEQGRIPPNPKAIMREIMTSGRSVRVPEGFDDWREGFGLPPIGETISPKALEEQRKIFGAELLRRLEA